MVARTLIILRYKPVAELVQLGVNMPSVIPCAAQLLKVLGVDDLTEASFMLPSTRHLYLFTFL